MTQEMKIQISSLYHGGCKMIVSPEEAEFGEKNDPRLGLRNIQGI